MRRTYVFHVFIMQLEMKKVGHNFVNHSNTVDMSSRGFRARSCFTKSHPAQYMHTIKHTVALCTRLFPMFINILPCNAVHHHTMSAVAESLIRQNLHILVFTEQKPQGKERGGATWGNEALLWGSGSHQKSQHRAASGQFAYGWHSHHAGHQQPDGLNEAFSAMGNFWQWQLVDQAPQQHWHLHADHASSPGSGQIIHTDVKLHILDIKDISNGTCMQAMHHHLVLVRSHMQIKQLYCWIKTCAPACRLHMSVCSWSDNTRRCTSVQ